MGEGTLSPNLLAIFAIRESRRSDLNPTDAAVLFSIASRLDASGRAYPSLPTIAGDAKTQRSTAAESVDYLRRLGILLVLEPIEGRSSNTYEVNLRALAAPPPADPVYRRTRDARSSAERMGESARRTGVSVRGADGGVREADGEGRSADGRPESAERMSTSPRSGPKEDMKEDRSRIGGVAHGSEPPRTARSGASDPARAASASSSSSPSPALDPRAVLPAGPPPAQASLFRAGSEEPVEEPAQGDEGARKGKGKRKKPETPLADDWAPSPDAVRWAIGKGAEFSIRWEVRDIELLTEQFRATSKRDDRRVRDWDQAWRNWILIGIERAQRFGGNKPGITSGGAFRPRETGTQAAGNNPAETWKEGITAEERERLAEQAKERRIKL